MLKLIKTEEAKRLLRYSDKPITAISSYLGFFFSQPLFPGVQSPCVHYAGRVPGKAPVILPGFTLPVRPLGR